MKVQVWKAPKMSCMTEEKSTQGESSIRFNIEYAGTSHSMVIVLPNVKNFNTLYLYVLHYPLFYCYINGESK